MGICLAEALNVVHEAGYVHRDVKPEVRDDPLSLPSRVATSLCGVFALRGRGNGNALFGGGKCTGPGVEFDGSSGGDVVLLSFSLIRARPRPRRAPAPSRRGAPSGTPRHQNCLIGADGYLKLADFGLAKPLPCVLDIGNGRVEAVGVSYTMCGSPEFMAPESVLSLGYDRTADYWAFGCVLFELFFGHNPFDNGGDLKATFVAVASIGLGKSEITFPPEANGSDEWAEDLLRRLLVSKSRRIASPHLFRHPFFEGISVEQLRRKELVAPFRPVLQSAIDTSYLAMPAPESIVEAPVFIRPPTDEPDPFEAW